MTVIFLIYAYVCVCVCACARARTCAILFLCKNEDVDIRKAYCKLYGFKIILSQNNSPFGNVFGYYMTPFETVTLK
jgi:hypothetical protein